MRMWHVRFGGYGKAFGPYWWPVNRPIERGFAFGGLRIARFVRMEEAARCAEQQAARGFRRLHSR